MYCIYKCIDEIVLPRWPLKIVSVFKIISNNYLYAIVIRMSQATACNAALKPKIFRAVLMKLSEGHAGPVRQIGPFVRGKLIK